MPRIFFLDTAKKHFYFSYHKAGRKTPLPQELLSRHKKCFLPREKKSCAKKKILAARKRLS